MTHSPRQSALERVHTHAVPLWPSEGQKIQYSGVSVVFLAEPWGIGPHFGQRCAPHPPLHAEGEACRSHHRLQINWSLHIAECMDCSREHPESPDPAHIHPTSAQPSWRVAR